MPPRARPLSPHLQIYRWQISNTLSILHRLTGVVLSLGLVALVAWLAALASGAAAYARVARVLGGPLGLLLLAGASFAFFYHLLNGIRHLVWDTGRWYGRRERRGSGWFVVAGAIALTALAWVMAAHFGASTHG